MEKARGRLWLIPNLIAPGSPERALAPDTLAAVRKLRHFVVEAEKAAWKFLSAVLDREALAEVSLQILDEHTPAEALRGLLAPALQGMDLGILSEAGIPCVADPGAPLVALAHDEGLRVIPLSGPSSIILALAASGLDGQRFSFLGYLPPDRPGRRERLKELGRGVQADGATRIFIETPYRNDHLIEDCLEVLPPTIRLCVAAGIGSEEESIVSASISSWKTRDTRPGKVPAIFMVGAVPKPGPGKSQTPRGSPSNASRSAGRESQARKQ